MVMMTMMLMMMMMMNFECLSFCEARFQNFCSVLQFGNFISKCFLLLLLLLLTSVCLFHVCFQGRDG